MPCKLVRGHRGVLGTRGELDGEEACKPKKGLHDHPQICHVIQRLLNVYAQRYG